MLDLSEALERAELMSDDSLHLSEQSYELLVDKLAEEDIYAFTMGLVDRGIMVRQAQKAERTSSSIEDKLVRCGQSFTEQSPGGVWLPSGWDEGDEEELQDEDLQEVQDGEYESFLESTPFTWPHSEGGDPVGPNVDELRDVLENAGIRITPDGKVEMYKSHIPGIYTDKLPQGALPADIAVKYYDQILDSADMEQTKLDGLLDLLTRLNSQTYDLEMSIEDLQNYGYSPASRSESSQAISTGLAQVQDMVESGNWNGAQRVINDLRGTVDVYRGERESAYDETLAVADALNRLADMQEDDPESYGQVVDSLGAMPYAAQKKAFGEYDYDEPDPSEDPYSANRLEVTLSTGYLDRVKSEFLLEYPEEPVPSVEEMLISLDGYDDTGHGLLDDGYMEIDVVSDDSDFAQGEAYWFRGQHEQHKSFDITDDTNLSDWVLEMV
jgi:hypothetical protein